MVLFPAIALFSLFVLTIKIANRQKYLCRETNIAQKTARFTKFGTKGSIQWERSTAWRYERGVMRHERGRIPINQACYPRDAPEDQVHPLYPRIAVSRTA